jgi:heme oxygenase
MSVDSSHTQMSARRMLRGATADLHAKVDARFAGSFDGDAVAYAGFLSAMAAVVLPLERALEAAHVDAAVPDWAKRRRASLLLDDLRALEVVPPREVMPPPVEGEARQLGIVYVLEGSRLGGKLLLRRALAHQDGRVRAATQYLSHGAGQDLWSSFVARLDSSPAVARASDEAVAGARDTFAMFGGGAAHG